MDKKKPLKIEATDELERNKNLPLSPVNIQGFQLDNT